MSGLFHIVKVRVRWIWWPGDCFIGVRVEARQSPGEWVYPAIYLTVCLIPCFPILIDVIRYYDPESGVMK